MTKNLRALDRRSIERALIRRSALGLRVVARIIARSLRDEGSSGPRSKAMTILSEELLQSTPADPADIVGNYLRGYVLLGDPNHPDEVAWRLVHPRSVIDEHSVRVPSRIKQYARKGDLDVRLTAPLDPILVGCASRLSTWITKPVATAWRKLDEQGFVRACGAYRDGDLVAGLWGLDIGRTFLVMSTFHSEDNAGTVLMAQVLGEVGTRWDLIDCGFQTAHMPRFGAYEISLEEFKRRGVAGLKR